MIYMVVKHSFDVYENHDPYYDSVVGYTLTREQADEWCNKEMSNIDDKEYRGWDGELYPYYTITSLEELKV